MVRKSSNSQEGADSSVTPVFLTLEEAAELVKISVRTLALYRAQGLLEGCAFQVGKHVRVDRGLFLEAVRNGQLSR